MFLYNPTDAVQVFKIKTEKEPEGVTVSVEPGSLLDFEEYKQYLYVLKHLAPSLEVVEKKAEEVVAPPVVEVVDKMAKVRAARKNK